MKKILIFTKRNFIEMIRDPIIYIFCLGMPIFMIILFQVINNFINTDFSYFNLKTLIPGIIMFSFSFVMLLVSLLISKDKATAFLKRLYISPLKSKDFILGYALCCFIIGIVQEILCVFTGYIFSLFNNDGYFSFVDSILLIIEMIPILLFFIFFGILLGTLLNDKAAPGITSIIITLSGILGGAWMPLDTMGKFETFCKFLPFYPSVYLGRVITKASHSIKDYTNPIIEQYTLKGNELFYFLLPIILFTLLVIILSFSFFKRMSHKDSK